MQSKHKRVVFKLIKYLSGSLLPLLFWVFALFGFDRKYIAVLTLLSAMMHELGHLVAYFLICGDIGTPGGRLNGFRIDLAKVKRALSYREQLIITLGGPGINLALWLVLLPLYRRGGYLTALGNISLLTALSSLLPVEGYDGYGILKCILQDRERGELILVAEGASFIITTLVTVFSLYTMNFIANGIWIFGVFFGLVIEKIGKSVSSDNFGEK